jgi:hypothetical protein
MAITNGYTSLAEVKAALRITDTVDDALLELSIESASREIDGVCQRIFYLQTAQTRVYTPVNAIEVVTDDIVSLTSLKTADDAANFATTWSATDYQLEPLNGIIGGVPTPANRIRAVDRFLFPVYESGEATVQVVGTFGFAAVPTAIKQAATILSIRQFKRYDSPLGVAGFGDMGAMRVGRTDPDVEALIYPFRKVSVG